MFLFPLWTLDCALGPFAYWSGSFSPICTTNMIVVGRSGGGATHHDALAVTCFSEASAWRSLLRSRRVLMHMLTRRIWWYGLFAAVLSAAVLWRPASAQACTTFLLDQTEPVVGKSYDWDIDYGLAVVNKRGMAKVALALNPGDKAASWTSKYGSLTFNQYGCEFPNSGMNEAGLVVEIMWLKTTEYSPADDRPSMMELQWIQWALDGFANVPALVAAAPTVRVAPVYAKVHYLACDANSVCASFEYVGGKLVITTGASMPVKTLTNHTYAESAAFLAEHKGFGGTSPIPSGLGSLSRFVRASSLALGEQTESVPASAFAILDSVSQGIGSPWNIVHRPTKGRTHFRTYASKNIKQVDLSAFDLDCTSPMMLLDIHTKPEGDAADRFSPYDSATNKQLIENSLADILDELPPGAVNIVAAYPSAQKCTLGQGGSGAGGGQAGGGNADAGAGGAGKGGSEQPDGGSGVPTAPKTDGGCGCRLPRNGPNSSMAAAWLGLLALALGRRRAEQQRHK